MSLSNSLRAFLTVEWLHCSGGRSSSLGQLWRHTQTEAETERGSVKEIEKKEQRLEKQQFNCKWRKQSNLLLTIIPENHIVDIYLVCI